MPNDPTLDSVAPGGIVNLSDAPSGLDDATFDSLFPAEPTPVATASKQEPAPAPTAAPSPEPAPTQAAAPFLKGNKSIYNTPEAAVEGLNQKDTLIENLRQRYALTTGIDPITNQPVASVQQQQPQGVDYYNQPDAYLKDAYDAINKGNTSAYRDVQAKFMLDTLKPLQPLMQRMAREQALETVSAEMAGVDKFIGTAQYGQTLDTLPELKEAIQIAESDYRHHNRLPSLYKIAFLAGQGRQLPEILKANAAQQQQSTQIPPAQPRTTFNPSTPAPPQPTAKPSLRSIDGIKATIADAEARGLKLDF